MAAKKALDSSALLVLLRAETGGNEVRKLLETAASRDGVLHMTEVCFAEVKSEVCKSSGTESWNRIAKELPALPIEFHLADRQLSELAGRFGSQSGVSIADAFAAALAKSLKADLVSAKDYGVIEKEITVIHVSK